MSFNTFVTGTQKTYERKDTKIKMGTKVQFKTDEGNILNLIAVKHEQSELFDTWLCVDRVDTVKTENVLYITVLLMN